MGSESTRTANRDGASTGRGKPRAILKVTCASTLTAKLVHDDVLE